MTGPPSTNTKILMGVQWWEEVNMKPILLHPLSDEALAELDAL